MARWREPIKPSSDTFHPSSLRTVFSHSSMQTVSWPIDPISGYQGQDEEKEENSMRLLRHITRTLWLPHLVSRLHLIWTLKKIEQKSLKNSGSLLFPFPKGILFVGDPEIVLKPIHLRYKTGDSVISPLNFSHGGNWNCSNNNVSLFTTYYYPKLGRTTPCTGSRHSQIT